jgi:hypothetical protein
LLALALAPPLAAQNLLPSGTFDTGIAGWTTLVAPSLLTLGWSPVDAHGSPTSGSLRAVNSNPAAFPIPTARHCLPASPGQRHHARGAFFYPSGQSHAGRVVILVFYTTSPTCSGPTLNAVSKGLELVPDTWQTLDSQPTTAPPGTTAVGVLFGFQKIGDGGQAIFNLDDAVLETTDLVVGCFSDDTALCLNGGRFRVTATWETPDTTSGSAHAMQLTGDTGYLWFFGAANVEAVIKVLNGCPVNGHYWVFAGGLTNVELNLLVEDLAQEEISRPYANPQGQPFEPIQDTSAFAACP